MKTILILIFSLSIIFAKAQTSIHIGMSQDELKNINSDMNVSSYEKTSTYTRPDTLFGLESKWGYRFNGHTIKCIFLINYI